QLGLSTMKPAALAALLDPPESTYGGERLVSGARYYSLTTAARRVSHVHHWEHRFCHLAGRVSNYDQRATPHNRRVNVRQVTLSEQARRDLASHGGDSVSCRRPSSVLCCKKCA